MPIPLAAIPNAPRLGPDPAMTSVPNANANLSGVARNLMTPEMQQGALDGAARGLGSIGDSVAGLGEVGARISSIIKDANERKAKFQDDVSIATRMRLRNELKAQYDTTLMSKSEDKWLPDWQENYAKEAAKIDSDYPLSADGQQRFAAHEQGFMSSANTGLITGSNKSAVDRGDSEQDAYMTSLYEEGKIEEARAVGASRVSSGARMQHQIDERFKELDEKRQANEIMGEIQRSPVEVAEDFKALRDGTAPPHVSEMWAGYFDGPDGNLKLNKWEGEAARYAQGIQTEKMNEVLGRMTQGETFDEDQIRGATDGKVDDVGVATLVKAGEKSPKYNPEKVSKVRTMLVNYDGDSDKDMSQWNTIQNEISTSVPKDMQSTFRSELDQEYTRSRDGKPRPKEAELRSAIQSRVDTYAKSALFGPTGMGTETGERGKIVDQVASDKVWARAEQVKLDFDSWLKDHSEASPEDASKWLNEVVNSDLMKSARNELDARGAGAPWPLWVANPLAAGIWNMNRDPGKSTSVTGPKTGDLNKWRESKPLDGPKAGSKKSLSELKEEADAALSLPTDPGGLIPTSS